MALSFIGVIESGGNIKGVRLEYPNVIIQTGNILMECYSNKEDVYSLIQHGVIEHLKESEESTMFVHNYNTDIEPEQYAFSEMQKLKRTYRYIYLYDIYKHIWFFVHENTSNPAIYPHPDKISLNHALALQHEGKLFCIGF